MKFIAAPILFLLLLTQIFSKWLLVAEYAVNKEFIAKNLCVNKAKPKLKCHGKCQLMKKMAEETENSNSGSGSGTIKSNLSEALPNHDLSNVFMFTPPTNRISHNAIYLLLKYTAPLAAIFHPPLA